LLLGPALWLVVPALWLTALALWLAVPRAPALRARARCRIRRRVRCVSLTFADFDFVGFNACGLTCAAHTAGAKQSPPTTTTRRSVHVPRFHIFRSFP
jgi:hypothetical protein